MRFEAETNFLQEVKLGRKVVYSEDASPSSPSPQLSGEGSWFVSACFTQKRRQFILEGREGALGLKGKQNWGSG